MIKAPLLGFERQVMAVERVNKLLRETTAALERARIGYAVVGGNAVAVWVGNVNEAAVRATKDVDILIRRDDLFAVSSAVASIGLVPHEVLGVHMLLDESRPDPRLGVHLLLAGEKIHASNRYAPPDPNQSVMTQHGYRVIELIELIKMKLQAFRSVDRTHLIDMHGVGLITPELIDQLPEDLKTRLTTALREG